MVVKSSTQKRGRHDLSLVIVPTTSHSTREEEMTGRVENWDFEREDHGHRNDAFITT